MFKRKWIFFTMLMVFLALVLISFKCKIFQSSNKNTTDSIINSLPIHRNLDISRYINKNIELKDKIGNVDSYLKGSIL